MTAQTLAPRYSRIGEVCKTFQWESVSALTTGTSKGRYLVPTFCSLREVFVSSGTAGSGGTSDIIDVNIDGTTIFTTQANRPTLLVGDTGTWSLSGLGAVIMPPEVTSCKPGTVITYDVDQVCTTGSALVTITLIFTDVR